MYGNLLPSIIAKNSSSSPRLVESKNSRSNVNSKLPESSTCTSSITELTSRSRSYDFTTTPSPEISNGEYALAVPKIITTVIATSIDNRTFILI